MRHGCRFLVSRVAFGALLLGFLISPLIDSVHAQSLEKGEQTFDDCDFLWDDPDTICDCPGDEDGFDDNCSADEQVCYAPPEPQPTPSITENIEDIRQNCHGILDAINSLFD